MSIGIFNSIAPRYDTTNHVLSLGMDRGWRRKMLAYLPLGNNLKILDLATGTADVALALAGDPRVAEVVGIDAAEGMLSVGREKAGRLSFAPKIKLLKGDALALDLPDRHFDAVTAAFGLRNFPDLMKGLAEAYRVIKPGGRLIVLEFSLPQGFLVKYVHGFYLKVLVPFIGRLLTGEKEPYQYLSSTARAFPSGKRFSRIMAQTGLEDVQCYPLAMGAVTIYVGKRSLDDAL
jgi:demethylmenaquinone methyltransferase/2-methoxy-6-polyprenyl-1,4-benzoquinol methylase